MPTGITHASMGLIIGLPAAIVIAVLTVIITFLLATSLDKEERIGITLGGGVVLLVTAFTFVLTWWPFDNTYHHWTEVAGTVSAVDSRLLGNADGAMSDVYLITYTETDQKYRCDDTRCAGIKKGDELTLSCKPEWQLAATDGWSCRFVSSS